MTHSVRDTSSGRGPSLRVEQSSEPSAASAPAGDAVAWMRLLSGGECKPDGRCYDLIFCDPHDERYRPLYLGPPAPAVEVREALERELEKADGCFEAALTEGWTDALAEGDIERIRDLYHRRIEYARDHIMGAQVALANLQEAEDSTIRAADMVKALEFYADPFVWKKKHDPDDAVSVPDFYSETSFGDTALAALSASPREMVQSSDGGEVLWTDDRLTGLIDWAYRHATEGQTWPSRKTQSGLVASALIGPPSQADADKLKPGPSEPSPSSRSETAAPALREGSDG